MEKSKTYKILVLLVDDELEIRDLSRQQDTGQNARKTTANDSESEGPRLVNVVID